ncbi:MAG: Arsenical pump-driving ATPase [Actinomycetia bacterium]|nr:Arsenical pump-driving ATPase [Actinomycetes bacterium]
MRILLFTGKGGVGKTTTAAATAVRAAEAGNRVMICSTDPAHSLADAFACPIGSAPTAIPGVGAESRGSLHAQQLDARERLEAAWGEVRQYLVALLDWAGAEGIEAEELAVIPGLDEVFALADIKEFAESGDYDLVVVDCAPTAETLRLLSLPDVLGWYMHRVFPAQRALTRAVRPLLRRVVDMPVAGDGVFDAVRRFYARLDGVRELLTDGAVTSARLVVNPEQLVVAEARRTFTYLSLFGYHVDAVIVNRLLPDAITDPWFDAWKAVQSEQLTAIRIGFEPVPLLCADLAPEELIGPARLEAFAESLYRGADCTARLVELEPFRVEPRGAEIILSMLLPFTTGAEIDLVRRGDELFLALGAYRRSIVLPDALARREVARAHLHGDRLEVAFREPVGG